MFTQILALQDNDEEKINHRIPHRFEPLTNIGANWCCHCGYMLPLGRKNARKCSECDITCHANCAHLVPDFCGMSMETANELLRNWRDINRARGGKAGAVGRPQPPHTQSGHGYAHTPTLSDSQMAQLGGGMDRLKLTGADSPSMVQMDPFGSQSQSPSQDRFPLDSRQQQQQQHSGYPGPQSPSPAIGRPPPGAKMAVAPGYESPVMSPASGRPNTGGYEYPSPVGLDGYSQYSVSELLAVRTQND
jgi:hypothetical protein